MLFIITTTVPKPVKTYINREDALATIATLLKKHSTLFLHGIPGIGKSELIKDYCKTHCTDQTLYTNDEMNLLLENVHYHTMTVELIARLLSLSQSGSILFCIFITDRFR